MVRIQKIKDQIQKIIININEQLYALNLYIFVQQLGIQTAMPIKELKINIVLSKQGEETWPISIKQNITTTQNNEILLNQLILKLKRQNFNDFFDSSVSYYHHQREVFVYGFFVSKTINQKQLQQTQYGKYLKKIPQAALQVTNNEIYCKLKFRKKIKSKIQLLIEQQQIKFGQQSQNQHRKNSKQKEKTVGQVIQKVALWRKLYTGFPSQNGQIINYELDAAASKIDVIKKTLDDYLLQIRNGKRHGYNFQKNKDSKIGDLRSFVRQRRQVTQKK